jgi:hypothetical protein
MLDSDGIIFIQELRTKKLDDTDADSGLDMMVLDLASSEAGRVLDSGVMVLERSTRSFGAPGYWQPPCPRSTRERSGWLTLDPLAIRPQRRGQARNDGFGRGPIEVLCYPF